MENFNRMDRLANRVIRLVSRKDQHKLIGIVGEKTTITANEYLNSQKAVQQAESKTNKEMNESYPVMEMLGKEYDRARIAIKNKASNEAIGAVASEYKTPDDLLNASEKLEEILLTYKNEKWAQDVIETLSPIIDSATKEWTEAIEAGDELQKIKNNRRLCARRFLDELIQFRRAVRSIYGKTSREYRSLTIRLGKGESDIQLQEEEASKTEQNPVNS